MIRVGIVGYSAQKFDREKAQELIEEAFDKVAENYPKRRVTIVSGLTDLGIPALAYREAKKRGWKTIGIAPECAKQYELFPCDTTFYKGKDWGDESEFFLENIDLLVKIGGGKQSKTEFEKVKDMGKEAWEYALESEESKK